MSHGNYAQSSVPIGSIIDEKQFLITSAKRHGEDIAAIMRETSLSRHVIYSKLRSWGLQDLIAETNERRCNVSILERKPYVYGPDWNDIE